MKRVFAFLLSFVMLFSLTSCKNYNGEITLSSKTTSLNSVNYNKSGSNSLFDDEEFLNKLSNFSNRIFEISSKNEDKNYVMSPLSIYMALSILHSVGDENVKNDIETLFGMTPTDIEKTGKLFLSLITEKNYNDKIITKLDLTNSIWFDSNVNGNKEVLNDLAEKLYCFAYETSFSNNNKQANKDIREFIKQRTNGLIDSDFDLSPETIFAIINTLYFKDIWNTDGNKLEKQTKDFKTLNEVLKKEFLVAKYEYGKVSENDISKYFYATTESGYKIKFIIPKEGYSLKDAMSSENLNKINAQKYFYDESEEVEHYTRCIFPKFKVCSETDLKTILENNSFLENAFSGYTSNIINQTLQVSDIIHKSVIDVNDEGIEGAAVTIIASKLTSVMPEKPVYYHDFVVDKNFGFIITDASNTILFEGQITNP